MSDETPKDFELGPNWFKGFDDQVDGAERRRRKNHIENVHVGDWLVLITRGHPAVGYPIQVKGFAPPLILCYNKLHDIVHCIDVRQHAYSHAGNDYVEAFHDLVKSKKPKRRPSAPGTEVSFLDILAQSKPPDEEPPCPMINPGQ